MHTNNRLQDLKILKLKDEIILQEMKVLWRWENKKIPISLANLVTEKQDRLRGRRFVQKRNAKIGSITYRFTSRANSCMQEIAKAKTRAILSKNSKQALLSKYTFVCRERNCYICTST